MYNHKTGLKEAIKFHGHLGPWLVLGLMMGELALKRLKARKHFGLEVKAWGLSKRPKSCLIDGLQLSTGATYGKGNIRKFNSPKIRVTFCKKNDKRKLSCVLDDALEALLGKTTDHQENEKMARDIYRLKPEALFKINREG